MNAFARRIALLATCAALTGTPPALAQMVSTYIMPAPALTVVDLDPDDGIAAHVHIASVETTLTADITSADGTQSDRSTPPPFVPDTAELTRGATTASARTNGALNDLALQVAAYPEEAFLQAEVTGQQVVTFSLTPHAHVAITGHLSLRGGWEGTGPGTGNSYGWVSASLAPADDPWGMSIYRSLRIYGTQLAPVTRELDYLLSYSNDSDAIVTMTWTLQTSLENEVNAIPAIPEPGGWAMLLGGMLLYAAGAARRRRHGHAPW